MHARVMISSVTNDEIPRGDLTALQKCWFEPAGLDQRLGTVRSTDQVRFSAIRAELKRHLEGKYDFEAYVFEDAAGPARAPEVQTLREAETSDVVVGIFGSKLGWKVPDLDPLTPTLREWRAALDRPLKFKLFWLKGSIRPQEVKGDLGKVLQEIANYKQGKMYTEFTTAADLFVKIDRAIQAHINTAVFRFSRDTIAREPSTEAERWSLASYRERRDLMQEALDAVSTTLGVEANMLPLGTYNQPVSLCSVPDSFSIAEARKFVAYVFDDEGDRRAVGELGRLAIIACFRGVSDGQIRRHLGNVEATEIYASAWGLYAAEPLSGRQALYLPRCDNSLRMESLLSQAIGWLKDHSEMIQKLALHRQRFLDLSQGIGVTATKRPPRTAGVRKPLARPAGGAI